MMNISLVIKTGKEDMMMLNLIWIVLEIILTTISIQG